MRKLWIIFACALCLAGCSATQTMETIADELVFAEAEACRIEFLFPQDSEAVLLAEDANNKLYQCGDFMVAVQVISGGDLNRSLQTVTGFDKDSLTVMRTERDGVTAYNCAWSAAGEGEDQVCRAVILDDGVYNYAVTVMADYTKAADLDDTWQEMLNSVELSTD